MQTRQNHTAKLRTFHGKTEHNFHHCHDNIVHIKIVVFRLCIFPEALCDRENKGSAQLALSLAQIISGLDLFEMTMNSALMQ